MKWATRAWKYQESAYSSRCILFTAHRVFYSCIQGLNSEEREEGITITSGLDGTLLHHRVRRRDPEDATALTTSEVPSSDEYALHVESFTDRHLSYQSDVLKAFTAVMSDMTTNLGFRFCWGLPTEIFELALCWTPSIPLHLINLIDDSHFSYPAQGNPTQQQNRRQGFPSWSWSGHQYDAGVVYSSALRSILQSRGSLVSHITWPWDLAYEISNTQSSDVFQSGLLDIEVELATMVRPENGRSFIVDDDDNTTLHFDDLSTWEVAQSKTCIRICEAVTTYNIWDSYGFAASDSENESENRDDITETTLSVLFTVTLKDDGTFERDGLFVLHSSEWDAQQRRRQRIQLG